MTKPTTLFLFGIAIITLGFTEYDWRLGAIFFGVTLVAMGIASYDK